MVDNAGDTINALIEAVEAIEKELGITPSGVYADVRVRIDILEARINNPYAPAPNVENPFFIGDDGVTISTGDGYPTITPIPLPGSLYLRQDGYDTEGLYQVRADGYWHQIDTDPFTAAGDLSGTIYSQTVIGLQGRPMLPTAPGNTPVGDGYVVSWNSSISKWEPQPGFYAAGDLDGYKVNQRVVNIQGYKVLMGTLGSTKDGYSLIWNNGSNQWEPQRLAAVFSPLNDGAATNIRSNRYLTQSSVDDSYVGIVNFSSDSVLITAGSAANYATIVGGDQNTVTGDYGFIGGGLSNTIVAANSVIVGGTSNNITIGSDLSFIGGGNAHVIVGDRSVIVGGDTNSIAGAQSAILGGVGNAVNGNLSVVVLGHTNIISPGQYNAILNGNDGYIMSGNYSTIINGIMNTVAADQAFIASGQDNTVNGSLSSIINGNNNYIVTGYSYTTILNGDNNTVTGSNNTLLNGTLNTITASGVITLGGTNNTISSNKVLIFGDSNSVTGSADYATVFGDHNTVNTGSTYSANWGSNNTINDGYVSMFGDHNTTSVGATFADVHGRLNSIGNSTYVSVHGDQNIVNDFDDYSIIVGTQNTIANGSTNVFISGKSNTVNAASSGSGVWGDNNNITGNLSNVWGNHNTTTADLSIVFGSYGKTVYPGQFSVSARAIDDITVGSSQYSKVILDGTGTGGLAFELKIPGSGSNLELESGKSYDMTIRVLINNTTGGPTCARHVFDVLAHCESGTLILDVVNTTISNDNGTLWTVSLSASTNQLIITVDGPVSGSPDRRAIATVDWRELSRI